MSTLSPPRESLWHRMHSHHGSAPGGIHILPKCLPPGTFKPASIRTCSLVLPFLPLFSFLTTDLSRTLATVYSTPVLGQFSLLCLT